MNALSCLKTACGLLMLLGLSGCADIAGIESDPGIEPATCKGALRVRIASDFSGTATDIAIPHFFGIYDYLRSINDSGGLNGCNIEIQVADNSYSAAGMQANLDAWRATDPNWGDVNTLFTFGTGPTQGIAPSVMAEKKVIIPGSYAGALATPTAVDDRLVSYPIVSGSFEETRHTESKDSVGYPYVFFPATDYGTAIRLAIQVAWEVKRGRVAMAYDNTCAYCVDPLAAGKSYVGSLAGMKLGRDLIFKQTSAEADAAAIDAAVQAYFEAEVAQLLADPDYEPVTWIWSGNSVYSTSLLGRSIARVQRELIDDNTDPRFPAKRKAGGAQHWKLRVIANNWGIGETTPAICGEACNNDNFYGLFPVFGYGDVENSRGMSQLMALHERYAVRDNQNPPQIPRIVINGVEDSSPRTPEKYRDVRYVQGYVAALMWHMGMEQVIKAGHRHPTGENLKTAFEKFKNVDLHGLTASPISFDANDHRPQAAESIFKLDASGSFRLIQRYNINLVDDWRGW